MIAKVKGVVKAGGLALVASLDRCTGIQLMCDTLTKDGFLFFSARVWRGLVFRRSLLLNAHESPCCTSCQG